MAKLTTAARKAIPTTSFALPGRRYPIEDRSHAANALARVSQHGTPAEKVTVRSRVHARYPTMGRGAAHGYGSGPIPPQGGSTMGTSHPDHRYMNRHNG